MAQSNWSGPLFSENGFWEGKDVNDLNKRWVPSSIVNASGAITGLVRPDGTVQNLPTAYADAIIYPASQFNILPTNTAAQNDVGFATASEFFRLQNSYNPCILQFEAGVYNINKVLWNLVYDGNGSDYQRIRLRGAGRHVTIIQAAPTSTAKCLFEVLCGYASFEIEGLSIWGTASVAQDVLGLYAMRRSAPPNQWTGGLDQCSFIDMGLRSYGGECMVVVGGDGDYLAPMQFFTFYAPDMLAIGGSCLRTFGQCGQWVFINGNLNGGFGDESAGSCVALSPDSRSVVAPSSVSTLGDFVQVEGLEIQQGSRVRVIGAVPGGLSEGVTYVTRKWGLNTPDPRGQVRLHTSYANALSNTAVNLTSSGTIGSWWIGELYAVAVSGHALVFERSHHLVNGASIRFVGASLPTGVTTGVTYYVVRMSDDRIRLASTFALARAGTHDINMIGGDPTKFLLDPVGVNGLGPYSFDFLGTTMQHQATALHVHKGYDIRARLHVEECRNSFYIRDSVVTIDGGDFQNGAADGGRGCWLAAGGENNNVNITGQPVIIGTTDKYITNFANSALTGADSLVEWSGSAGTPSAASKSTGVLRQMAAAATLVVGGNDIVFVNASATPITRISTTRGPRSRVTLIAWGGSIVLSDANGFVLPSSPLTVPDKGSVTLELVDTIGIWLLVSRSFP